MTQITVIKDRNGGKATIIKQSDSSVEGIVFYTEPESQLQVGDMLRPAGYEVPMHRHQPCMRNVIGTPEVLIVREGAVELLLIGESFLHPMQTDVLHTILLRQNDVVMLDGIAHGLRFITKARVLEVKQGAYIGDDKVSASLWEGGPTT